MSEMIAQRYYALDVLTEDEARSDPSLVRIVEADPDIDAYQIVSRYGVDALEVDWSVVVSRDQRGLWTEVLFMADPGKHLILDGQFCRLRT
jgi:hypothetical protein